MNIAIIDDERVFVERLKNDIAKICTNNAMIYSIDTFNTAENIALIYNNYNLIFLDIDMPNIDGITALNIINKSSGRKEAPYVAFVTSKENLVFKALKEFPYTFIRKTDLDNMLEACLCNIYEKLNQKKMTYSIRDGRKIINVYIKDIIYIEKIKNYVWFHTLYGNYKERSTIEEKFMDLSSQNFVRTHIGFLVNLKYVFEISPKCVALDNGENVPISPKYYNYVHDKYYESLVIEND